MKFRKKIHRPHTIRARILWIFAAVMAVNIFFSLAIYAAAISNIRKTIYDKMNIQAELYLETVDTTFKNTETMLYNMFSDRKLIFLTDQTGLLNDYELRDAYLSEQERITLVKESNPLVEEAVIYLPNNGMKISDTFIEEMEETDYEQTERQYVQNGYTVNFRDGLFFMASSGIPVYMEDRLPDALFVVEFGKEKLLNTLRAFNGIQGGGSFLYEESQQMFLDSTADENVSKAILQKIQPVLQENGTIDHVSVRGEKYQLSVSKSDYLGYYVQYAPEREVLKGLSGYRLALGIYLALTAVAVFFFAEHIEKVVHRPLDRLTGAFARVDKDNLYNGGPEYVGTDEFSYLFDGFNQMQERTKALIGELVQQKALTQQAELKQLQAQINPHFLYNSFYSLRAKIRREDMEGAERLASLLGAYFRFLTRNGESEVSLKSEVEHARNYAEIQYMRFHDRMRMDFEPLPEKYENISVPRLILQPVIENGFKYALEEREEGGMLRVSFTEAEDGFLEIRIEDNGEFCDEKTVSDMKEKLGAGTETTGTVNIHRRLLLRFGEGSGLDIARSSLGGAMVAVRIPAEDARLVSPRRPG